MEIVAAASSSPPLVATIYARKDVEEIEGGKERKRGKEILIFLPQCGLYLGGRTEGGAREETEEEEEEEEAHKSRFACCLLFLDPSLGLEERGDERRDSIRPRCCFHISPIFFIPALSVHGRDFF